ncbi:MAG TPA: hypothetical protein VHM25_12200 [Polyangiaceae bacterium]|nr:hypothetical protein [Polyangiaceae bacterium]
MSESAKIRLGEPVYRDAHHVLCVWENTLLTYSNAAPNLPYLKAWTQTVELVAEQFAEGLLVMTIIDQHTRAPDDNSKAHIRNTLIRYGAKIGAFAYVVEGEGFGAATLRSAISLISLAARYPFPIKVFGHAADAAPWLLSRSRRTPLAEDTIKLTTIATTLREARTPIPATG